MFNMGFTEIIVLSVIALLVIGPKQLPEVARVIGRMLNEFKRATGDISSSLAGVKKEAQGFANQTQSYMHKQREEFEKKMKETVGMDEEANEESRHHDLDHDHYHEDDDHWENHAKSNSTESEQMNFELEKEDSDKGKKS